MSRTLSALVVFTLAMLSAACENKVASSSAEEPDNTQPTAEAKPATQTTPTDQGTPPQPQRQRGRAIATETRPDHFPHRIWAACGFEARTHNYGWFAGEETDNIPSYPGNSHARRAEGPYKNHAARMVGINPVPGPRMGTNNFMYCRYYLKGTDKATFQHYSLSVSDNYHIRVSGLTEGQWSEVTLNFTRDARRNDGADKPFQKGERMDDLKIFLGKPGDGNDYEMIIDDVIFFSDEPGIEPETEPFPRRVLFLAAFDTGIDEKSLPVYYPGDFRIVRSGPGGSYWGVVRAPQAGEGETTKTLRLDMKPSRPAGPNTKLRFRVFLQNADAVTVTLHDKSAEKDIAVDVPVGKQGQWLTKYVTFSAAGKTADRKDLPVGNALDALRFTVPADATLYVDEVVLYDAYPDTPE